MEAKLAVSGLHASIVSLEKGNRFEKGKNKKMQQAGVSVNKNLIIGS